jgi:hypothetical protein
MWQIEAGSQRLEVFNSRCGAATPINVSAPASGQGGVWRLVGNNRPPHEITRRLPAAEDGECQYEIRNTLEEYNRVARESELTRA